MSNPFAPSTQAVGLPAVDPLAHAAELLDRVQSLTRLHRLGVAFMYAPAFFICLTAGVAFSVVPWGVSVTPLGATVLAPWAKSLLAGLGLSILFSLPLPGIGIIIRLIFSAAISSFCRQNAPDQLPALPPPRRGEVLGRWRVAELSPRGVRLRRWIAPALLWTPIVWGVSSGAVALLHAIVVLMANGVVSSAVFGVAALGLWLAVLAAVASDKGFTLRAGPSGAAELETWSRWHPLLPRTVSTRPLAVVEPFRTDGALVLIRTATGEELHLDALAARPVGVWQARRLAAALNAMAAHLGSGRVGG